MFALIYDTHELNKPKKKVISLHRSRETAENALDKRKLQLGKSTLECDTRIVWVDRKLNPGDFVIDRDFSTWKQGERVPWGETHSDTD